MHKAFDVVCARWIVDNGVNIVHLFRDTPLPFNVFCATAYSNLSFSLNTEPTVSYVLSNCRSQRMFEVTFLRGSLPGNSTRVLSFNSVRAQWRRIEQNTWRFLILPCHSSGLDIWPFIPAISCKRFNIFPQVRLFTSSQNDVVLSQLVVNECVGQEESATEERCEVISPRQPVPFLSCLILPSDVLLHDESQLLLWWNSVPLRASSEGLQDMQRKYAYIKHIDCPDVSK